MGRPAKEFAGQTFGEWTVIGRAERRKHLAVWSCQCSCGSINEIYQTNLVSGQSSRCNPCAITARETNPAFHKLTAGDVIAIRSRTGESLTALGAEFGVSGTTIYHIRQRVTWKHLPDHLR